VLARLIRVFDFRQVRIARKNLANSIGICPPSAFPAFIRKVYDHLGLGFIEMLMIPRPAERRAIPSA
jgi:lauroyl/myristoyl acyltransferase